jgi:hypothetical protein
LGWLEFGVIARTMHPYYSCPLQGDFGLTAGLGMRSRSVRVFRGWDHRLGCLCCDCSSLWLRVVGELLRKMPPRRHPFLTISFINNCFCTSNRPGEGLSLLKLRCLNMTCSKHDLETAGPHSVCGSGATGGRRLPGTYRLTAIPGIL